MHLMRMILVGSLLATMAFGKGQIYVTGAGPGGGPHVIVYRVNDHSVKHSFYAYPSNFSGGVRVAVGDVNGDGIDDIITAAGPGGGPHVQVFSGSDRNIIHSFMAYPPNFNGGVYVAAGDVNRDGYADIITGADSGGGPHVQVFSGKDLSVIHSFMAYHPAFSGGVRVAAGDVNGDGADDIITAAGPGGGPHVQVFSGLNLSVLQSFFSTSTYYRGGVHVAALDTNNDGKSEVVTSPKAYWILRDAKPADSNSGLIFQPSYTKTLELIIERKINVHNLASGNMSANTSCPYPHPSDCNGPPPASDPQVIADADVPNTPANMIRWDEPWRHQLFALPVSGGQMNNDNQGEIMTGMSPTQSSSVSIYQDPNANAMRTFAPYGAFTGGVYVGAK